MNSRPAQQADVAQIFLDLGITPWQIERDFLHVVAGVVRQPVDAEPLRGEPAIQRLVVLERVLVLGRQARHHPIGAERSGDAHLLVAGLRTKLRTELNPRMAAVVAWYNKWDILRRSLQSCLHSNFQRDVCLRRGAAQRHYCTATLLHSDTTAQRHYCTATLLHSDTTAQRHYGDLPFSNFSR